jgi:hypothetical protein
VLRDGALLVQDLSISGLRLLIWHHELFAELFCASFTVGITTAGAAAAGQQHQQHQHQHQQHQHQHQQQEGQQGQQLEDGEGEGEEEGLLQASNDSDPEQEQGQGQAVQAVQQGPLHIRQLFQAIDGRMRLAYRSARAALPSGSRLQPQLPLKVEAGPLCTLAALAAAGGASFTSSRPVQLGAYGIWARLTCSAERRLSVQLRVDVSLPGCSQLISVPLCCAVALCAKKPGGGGGAAHGGAVVATLGLRQGVRLFDCQASVSEGVTYWAVLEEEGFAPAAGVHPAAALYVRVFDIKELGL